MKFTEVELKLGQFRSSDLVINFETGLVEKDGKLLVMPDLTWRTFSCLVHHQGGIVSIDQMIQSVWGDTHVSNETVAQRIKLLRRELGDSGQKPEYIETIRNRGFRWVPPIKRLKPQEAALFPRWMQLTVALTLGVVIFGLLAFEFEPTASHPSDLVLRGHEYLSRLTREDNQIASSLFEKALAEDLNDEQALIGLSFARSHSASKFNFPVEVAIDAERLARRALQLEESARAYHALAFSLDAQGRTSEAIREYERALDLDPDSASIMGSVAYLYQIQGKLARALEYGLASHHLDSQVPFSEVQVASTYHLLRNDQLATEWLNRGLLLKPDNVFVYTTAAQIAFALGEIDGVNAALEQAEAMNIERPELHVMKGIVSASEGLFEQAKIAFESAQTTSGGRDTGAAYLIWLRLRNQEREAIRDAVAWKDHHSDSEDPEFWVLCAGLRLAYGKDSQIQSMHLLDRAIAAGYRDGRFLEKHPMFISQVNDVLFEERLSEIRRLITIEQGRTD